MKNQWSEKKVSLGGAIIGGAITLVLGLVIGLNWEFITTTWGPYLNLGKERSEINWSSLTGIYNDLTDYYDGDINKDDLIEGAKKGMVDALGDIYTQYMNSTEASEYRALLEGEVGAAGVGVEIGKREDYVKVIRTLPDNPARRAGILAGDIIYAINDEEVWDKDTETIAGKLRGDPGTTVKLTVVRDGAPKDFTLTREEINNVSADISIEGKTAIISVYRFSTDTGELVSTFQTKMKESGVEKIILDLRNNGGGYVSAARDLLSLWIDGEKILVQKDKHGVETPTYANRGEAVFKDMKTVVLVNGSTASASEIVAGALKDYEKATVLGETTFGKGVVQQMLNVDGNALLKVTIAHWYTPKGSTINKTGIEPDVKVERTYDQINKGQDPQLAKAKELLK